MKANRQTNYIKKYRKNKRIMSFVLAFGIVMSLVGCGKKKQEDVSKDIQNLQEATASDAEQTQGNALPGETISFELSCSGGSEISVENLTFIDETDGSGRVYELDNKPISEAQVKVLAERLFDDGEYEVITPYLVASDSELQDERVFYETEFNCANYDDELSRKCRYNYQVYVMEELEGRENGQLQRETYVREEGQILCPVEEDTQNPFAPAWEIFGHGEIGILRGKVNGEYWMMEVLNHHLNSQVAEKRLENRTEIHIYSLREPQMCDDVAIDPVNDAIYGENRSDQKECENQAEIMLNTLGLGSPELLHTTGNAFMASKSLGGVETKTEMFQDGYIFNYGLFEQDNQPKLAFQDAAVNTNELFTWSFGMMPDQYIPQPSMYVSTYENQVQEIYILSYMPNRRVLTDKSEMLSQEALLEKTKSGIMAYYDCYGSGEYATSETIKNPKLVLKYILLSFEDDNHTMHYNMMPVWVLEMENVLDNKDADVPLAMFGVCAIDGSMVDFNYATRGLNCWFQ